MNPAPLTPLRIRIEASRKGARVKRRMKEAQAVFHDKPKINLDVSKKYYNNQLNQRKPMYGKLFASLYQGTMRGRPDELLVWTNLIACKDDSGFVDKHFRSIAEEVGISEERVRAAIATLESPDPESRSPDFEGRRLIRIDEHRAWGWKMVNSEKYDALRREEDRRQQNRIAQERFRNKNNPLTVINSKHEVITGNPLSAESAHIDIDIDISKQDAKASRRCFLAPSLDEWQRYGQTLDPPFPITEADGAFDYYVTNGWKQNGGNSIKDWKGACRNCHRRWRDKKTQSTHNDLAPRWQLEKSLQSLKDNLRDVGGEVEGQPAMNAQRDAKRKELKIKISALEAQLQMTSPLAQ